MPKHFLSGQRNNALQAKDSQHNETDPGGNQWA
jgi:hypothetical protein